MQMSEELLKSLYAESGVKMISDYIKMMLRNFQEKYPEVYNNSALSTILE